jgi:hypothetical protein
MGFEPTTPTLARLCSTPELHPRSTRETAALPTGSMPKGGTDCNQRAGINPTSWTAARDQPARGGQCAARWLRFLWKAVLRATILTEN